MPNYIMSVNIEKIIPTDIIYIGIRLTALRHIMKTDGRDGHAPGCNQTAETCSSSATRNDEPQPQAATTLGFSTLKPAPWRVSS